MDSWFALPSENPFFKIWIWFSFPAVGAIYGSELDSPRFGILLRSSTDENDSGASREHQRRVIKNVVERVGGTIVFVENVVESAATMDRESLDSFLEAAEKDEIDVLAVMEIDRLTRAPLFEAVDYYRELAERDCILYAESVGYVDWDDLNDLQLLMNQTIFARKWYERLREGQSGAFTSDLQEGKYPKGGTPFGFETDDENNIEVKEEEREFMYRAFDKMVRIENRSEVRRQLNEIRKKQGKEPISDTVLKTLLESPLCIGHLTVEGQVVNEVPSLQVVDHETYRRVQEILMERKPTESYNDIPDSFRRAADRYGLSYLMSIIESYKRCRECGGELDPNGVARLMGIPLQNYQCVDCDHQGPLLTESEIQEIHQSLPLRCPFCPAVDEFDVQGVDGFDEYEYTCKICELSMKLAASPNKIKRGLNNPKEMFEMGSSYWDKIGNSHLEESSSQKSGATEELDENQARFDKFVES